MKPAPIPVLLALLWLGSPRCWRFKQASAPSPELCLTADDLCAAVGVGSVLVRYSAFAERVPFSLKAMVNAIQMVWAASTISIFAGQSIYIHSFGFVAVFVFLVVRVFGWMRIRTLRSSSNGVILRFFLSSGPAVLCFCFSIG